MSSSASRTSGTDRIAEPVSVKPGDVLAGKFRVERVVGRGGMGVVIEATNVQLDQRVALKLLAKGADDPSAVERFSNEARAAARLRSEHVARVYDVGKDTLYGPFIVMELLEGRTLADVIQNVGRVALHRAVEYVIDACEGLAEAHARGIVHQDVKPGNLFLVTAADGRPSIKLLDFGIATMRTKERTVDGKSSHPSAGTPAYLAPEQVRGSPVVDHRADIWALGCVLYELLVGDRAFRATRFTELVTKILETPPHPFPEDLEIPLPIAAAIERCLEKDPTKRFTSTGELALTLLPFARRRAHSAVTRAVGHVKSAGLDPHLEVPSSMPPPPDSLPDFPSSANLRPPGVPSFSSPPASLDPSSSRTSAAPPSSTVDARHRSGAILLVSVVLLALAGGAVVWMRSPARTESPGVETPPATAKAIGASASTVETPTSVRDDTSSPPVGSVAMSAAPTATVAPIPRGRGPAGSSRPRAHGSAPGSAQAASVESDINTTR
jgi:serine/threonine-protein kinase